MKKSYIAIVAVILSAAAATGYYKISTKNPVAVAAAISPEKPTTRTAAPRGQVSETTEGTPRTRSAHSETAPRQTSIPKGIDPAAWEQASAIVTLLGSEMVSSMTGNMDSFIPKNESEKIREISGMDEAAFTSFMTLADARNKTRDAATKKVLEKVTSDPRTMTEIMALSAMEQKGTITPEQKQYLGEMEAAQAEVMKGMESDLMPWYQDKEFLADARKGMTQDAATKLDAYAEEQRAAAESEGMEAGPGGPKSTIKVISGIPAK